MDELCVEYEHIEGNDLQFKHPVIDKVDSVDVRVDIHPSAIGIVADFHVHYTATFSCVRCLKHFTTACDTSLILTYIEGADPGKATDNVDLAKTDIDKTYYKGAFIDLMIGIREAIMLSFPIAPLCKEDCAGLCPNCGINRNSKSCDCVVEESGLFTPAIIKEKFPEGRRKK